MWCPCLRRGKFRSCWRFPFGEPPLNFKTTAALIHKLNKLQAEGGRIAVGVIGCGAMGLGVARQTARTPAMDVVFVADINQEAAERGILATGKRPILVADSSNLPARVAFEETYLLAGPTEFILEAVQNSEINALVECSNSIYEAFLYCQAAIQQNAHVILMNAEVDLVLGRTLAHLARKHNVVVSSDAGDQHGVLATMADEIRLWGFKIVQAGNMKGFLNRRGNAASSKEWADKQKLSVVQTVSYTDGTKMNIEQALIGNYLGLTPIKPGMEGPQCADIKDVLENFDFDSYHGQGRVDYTVGVPWPGGGVYIVGESHDDDQHFLLNYYKVSHKRPYYLFFRPYHLCHLETPRAIAQAYFDNRPVIPPSTGPMLNDVYAYAKTDLAPGTIIGHAIGGDELYGLVNATAPAEADHNVPIYWFEHQEGKHCVLNVAKQQDEPIRWSDVTFPDTNFHRLLKAQQELGD